MRALLLSAALPLAFVLIQSSPGTAKGGPDANQFGRSGERLGDVHVRYPGDVGYSFGNTRKAGPDKGAYIERCRWISTKQFFGIPLGYQQRCVRYNNTNTR